MKKKKIVENGLGGKAGYKDVTVLV